MKAIPAVQASIVEAPTVRDAGYIRPGIRAWFYETLSKFSPERREAVERYLNYLEGERKSISTIERSIQAIRTIGYGGKPYEELTQEDLIEWMRKLPTMRTDGRNGGRYSERTVNSMRGLVKQFLKWIHNGKDLEKPLPECLRCIHVSKPKPNLHVDILTPDQLRKLVDSAENQRDRAMIFTCCEAGFRPHELLGMRIRDVQIDKYGAVLFVEKGKTGPRRVRGVNCVPDLQLWLNMHPMRDDPDAPLWPSKQGNHSTITESRFRGILKRCAKLAGVEKRVYPYLQRHSRATHLANGVLTESQMREFFGWTKNSNMPSIYVHLSGRDVDKTLLKHYGICIDEEKSEEKALKPAECARCRAKNPAGTKFCNICGAVLDIQTAIDLEKKCGLADDISAQVMQEFVKRAPELLERILEETGLKQKIAQLANGGV